MCWSGLTKNLAFVSGLGLPRTPHEPVNGCLMVPIIVGIWGIVELHCNRNAGKEAWRVHSPAVPRYILVCEGLLLQHFEICRRPLY